MTGEVFTPKEYANWLVDKYLIYCPVFYTEQEHGYDKEKAKQCALITIDSIYDSTRMLVSHYIKNNGVKAYMDIQFSKDLTLTYWREVKKEIEKL
jgi:hypothetical protein